VENVNLVKRPWKRTYFDEVEVVYENFVDPGPMQQYLTIVYELF